MEILYFTLWIGTVVLCVAYVKIREKIPFHKREKFEKWLMLSLIILLLVDVSLIIFQRRETALEMNDCIRFYRYFPYFYNDSEFYFVNKWCYEHFNEEEIQKLRKSGIALQIKQLEENNDLNKFRIMKGG